MENLTNENYYSNEINVGYMSASQYKDFKKCQACAMAKLKGEYAEEQRKAFIVGSYVDAYFTEDVQKYELEHHSDLYTKQGKENADNVKAHQIIDRIERSELFKEFIGGEHQVIMTGFIGGVEFKIKIDSLHEDKIVDLKCMKDIADVWVDGSKVSFIEAFGYDIQGAIYQAVVAQNIGEKLPFYLAVATKEDVTDLKIIHISDDILAEKLKEVEQLAPVFDKIKRGELEAMRCEDCNYCKSTHELTEEDIIEY